jgi:hypothetical protein
MFLEPRNSRVLLLNSELENEKKAYNKKKIVEKENKKYSPLTYIILEIKLLLKVEKRIRIIKILNKVESKIIPHFEPDIKICNEKIISNT